MQLRAKNFFVFLLFSTSLLFISCDSKFTAKHKLPEDKPDDFNFILTYGYEVGNTINTIDEKYSYDMIMYPSLTIDLKLSELEMNTIYEDMRAINILNYPEVFKPIGHLGVNPYQSYDFKIFINGKEKHISWEDENLSSKSKAKDLRDLINKIEKIIESKDEYKKLPPRKGGYD